MALVIKLVRYHMLECMSRLKKELIDRLRMVHHLYVCLFALYENCFLDCYLLIYIDKKVKHSNGTYSVQCTYMLYI